MVDLRQAVFAWSTNEAYETDTHTDGRAEAMGENADVQGQTFETLIS